MKKLLIGMLASVMVLSLWLAIPEGHAKEGMVLKMASFLPKNDPNMKAWWPLVDEINERAKGELVVEYVGGPEAIPGFKQFEALRTGVLHMIFGCESYYGGTVTKAAYTHLTRLTPPEERKKGYYDFRVELLKKHNVFYLGRPLHHSWFHVFTNKAVKRPQELTGQKIRVSATYEPFIKALGAVPVTLPGGEVYTALERGTVDGYAWAVIGNVGFGWPEVCKYILEPRIYEMNIETLINLNTWEEIPKPLQEMMTECMVKNEIEYAKVLADLAESEYKAMQDAGMEVIKFSPEDTKWYIDLAYKAGWDEVIKNNPDLGPKLRELLTP